VTAVDRATRCILSSAVLGARTGEAVQQTSARAAAAQQDDSEACPLEETRVYNPGHHAVAPGTRQTDRVEADTADLRHDLARVGRRSRCVSRARAALRRAVKRVVHAWNRRHLHKRAFPRDAGHGADFVSPAF
jgi:IS1 family transposase